MIFENRIQAGKMLAEKLNSYEKSPKAIVIGLPRGGVVVAFEVAKKLNLPLDIIVTRKISDPINPEFAIGAVTEEGDVILDKKIISQYEIDQDYIDSQIKKEKKEAERRLILYRQKTTPLNLKGKIAIIVDDGIATGNTMNAAIKSAKAKKAEKIIVATPIIPHEYQKQIKQQVDKLISLNQPQSFYGVSAFYKKFDQVTDKEVTELMKYAAA